MKLRSASGNALVSVISMRAVCRAEGGCAARVMSTVAHGSALPRRPVHRRTVPGRPEKPGVTSSRQSWAQLWHPLCPAALEMIPVGPEQAGPRRLAPQQRAAGP